MGDAAGTRDADTELPRARLSNGRPVADPEMESDARAGSAAEPDVLARVSQRIAALPHWRWGALALLLMLIWIRAPGLFEEPRFWAEDATVYYAAALTKPFLAAATHVPIGTAGYLNLAASVPASLASALFPIELAPAVATASALLILVTAFVLILWGRSELWRSPASQLLACSIVLFAPSATGEVWLNTANAQVYCGLIALVLLCEDSSKWSARRLPVMMLFLLGCGLSGVYSIFLFPAYLYRWSWHRHRAMSAMVIVLAFCAAVQFAIFVNLAAGGNLDDTKFQDPAILRSLSYMLSGQVVKPLGLEELARLAASAFSINRFDPMRDLGWLPVPILGTAVIAGTLMLERRYRSMINLLALVFACLAILTMAGSIRGEAAGRYAVLSGFSLLFFFLAHATHSTGGPRRWIAAVMLLVSMAVGVPSYRDQPEFQCAFGCPSWRAEVELWKRHPNYRPKVWPGLFPPSGPQWRIALPFDEISSPVKRTTP